MPVLLDRGQLGWRLFVANEQSRGKEPPNFRGEDPNCLELGLINNMPDLALEQTERQILKLLDSAAGNVVVRLRLYALPDVPRGELGRTHLTRLHYRDVSDLWNSKLDGLIVTGAEPLTADLTQEPFWGTLTEVFNWADHHTTSTIASCFAVHAAVLYFDGIDRHSLDKKFFGVFEFDRISNNPLIHGIPRQIRMPHSRWNEIREDALRSCGYDILTRAHDGVDTFVKSRKSFFVFFQGHPEYESWTLFAEYRRDVARFLAGEQDTYPTLPRGYFDEDSALVLGSFRDRALNDRNKELMAYFPTERLTGKVTDTWRHAAEKIYSNWVLYLASDKAQRTRVLRSG
jgi:homoserine O-succinyltransferase/O-acetyltransferase